MVSISTIVNTLSKHTGAFVLNMCHKHRISKNFVSLNRCFKLFQKLEQVRKASFRKSKRQLLSLVHKLEDFTSMLGLHVTFNHRLQDRRQGFQSVKGRLYVICCGNKQPSNCSGSWQLRFISHSHHVPLTGWSWLCAISASRSGPGRWSCFWQRERAHRK